MTRAKDEIGFIIAAILVMSMVVVCATLVGNTWLSYDSKDVIVEGKIIHTIYYFEDESLFVEITFDNEESYTIKIYKDVDLTVNSRMVLKLKQYGSRNWFWDDYEWYDYYVIDMILKIPDDR